MKKNELKRRYKSKIKNYLHHSKLYFEKNNPQISDSEFDKLKFEIIDLEKKYNFLDDKNSPSKNVGFKPSKSFEKYEHKIQMLSFSNALNEEDLNSMSYSIENRCPFLDHSLFEWSCKIPTKHLIKNGLAKIISVWVMLSM